MAGTARKISRLERVLGIALLVVLAGMVTAVVFSGLGGPLHPAVGRSMATNLPQSAEEPAASASPLLEWTPESLQPLTDFETFGRETLSDKINGKADTYLQAGFEQLQTQGFALAGQPSEFVQIYLFDMAEPDNAFAVFSQQKRTNITPLDFTRYAYATANSVYFAHGRWYGELVGASRTDALMDAMLAFARSFIADRQPAARQAPDAGDLLPTVDLIEGSRTLLANDAFGYGGLDRVWTADYRIDGQVVTAFISRRADTSQAAELADGYTALLIEWGAAPVEGITLDAPHAAVVDAGGVFEIVFARGRHLSGVHEAMDLRAALKLARRLDAALSGVEDAPEPAADR